MKGIVYAIKRSDGLWYLGTTDRDALWGSETTAATFGTPEEAETRCVGLREAEGDVPMVTFEVKPSTVAGSALR